jgi:uncharacterized protein YndB with AHSA1/START domain
MNPNDFDPGPLAEVECRRSGDRWTLVFVRKLRHPPERVWAALTDPAQLREWSPFTADRDLGSVGPATLTMIDGDTQSDLPANVSRADRPTLLEYTWGTDRLRWELVASDSGTQLTLLHTTDDASMVPKVAAGWHLCLVVAGHLLDGQPIGPIVGANAMNYGWNALHDAYAEQLGILDAEATDGR